MTAELDQLKEIKSDKLDYNPNQARIIGCKYITNRQLKRDVYSSNRFQKVQKRTIHHLQKVLDKHKIRDVVKSLRHANREILKENKVKEILDDYIYL